MEIREEATDSEIKLAVKITDSSGASVISIGDLTDLDSTTVPSIKVTYPKYLDKEKIGTAGSNGVAATNARFEDTARGAVKICDDGSQYITVKGNNGEEISFFLDSRLTNPTHTAYTDPETGESYDIDHYDINLTGTNKLDITLTGKGAMDLHIGANEEEVVTCSLPRISLERLDLDNLDVTTQESARYSIDRVQYALKYVSSARARIGAYTNRVEHSISYLAASNENLSASMSRIQDTDMAAEMTNYASQQVLVQAATSMLAQANQAPQQALQLIQ